MAGRYDGLGVFISSYLLVRFTAEIILTDPTDGEISRTAREYWERITVFQLFRDETLARPNQSQNGATTTIAPPPPPYVAPPLLLFYIQWAHEETLTRQMASATIKFAHLAVKEMQSNYQISWICLQSRWLNNIKEMQTTRSMGLNKPQTTVYRSLTAHNSLPSPPHPRQRFSMPHLCPIYLSTLSSSCKTPHPIPLPNSIFALLPPYISRFQAPSLFSPHPILPPFLWTS